MTKRFLLPLRLRSVQADIDAEYIVPYSCGRQFKEHRRKSFTNLDSAGGGTRTHKPV